MSDSIKRAGSGLEMNPDRTLSWDWYPGRVPDNVNLDAEAYLETTFSFHQFRGRAPGAVTIARGASIYLGTMFDVGPAGRVEIGEFALIHGARIICDSELRIGPYSLISWNVVFMDNHRVPWEMAARRVELEKVPGREPRWTEGGEAPRPIRIGPNVWIGFDVCVLPGVTIGEGSIVGARSVVDRDVPAFTVVGGNPARVIRELEPVSLPAFPCASGGA